MQAIVDKTRSGARYPDLRCRSLILLFILVPIAEIYVIIQVGQAIGALSTVVLLIVDSIVGAWLLRWQGRRAWAAFRRRSRRAASPTARSWTAR